MTYRKKLIEVALPLEAINAESAREKSIRHGHPSTLHLWWARRPLAACRAVLWASLVDDPSSWPDKFPTEEEQEIERQRLFDILARFETLTDKKGNTKQVVKGLVSWDDIKEPAIIIEAQKEIARCLAWERGEKPPVKPDKVREYITKYAPPVYDPFAGGGSIPLEAQRLGLEAHASDLNPVAVLINKALIEIPPKFRDQPPVNPVDRQRSNIESWKGAQGLAADVRYYGKWMRNKAFERIGHLYPKINIPSGHGEQEATVVAWIWARTVKCANPGCGCQMPLVRSFQLSNKKGKEAWIEPIVDQSGKIPVISFEVKTGKGEIPEGTVNRKGATCIVCKTPIPLDYIRTEAQAKRMNNQLIGIVADSKKGRVYLSPNSEHENIAGKAKSDWKPSGEMPLKHRNFQTPNYGMTTFGDLFTSRQLLALNTFSDLVSEVREKIRDDAITTKMFDDGLSLNDGGKSLTAYADALAVYLGFGIDRLADRNSAVCSWDISRDSTRNTFARQAIPMTWDFTEANPLSDSTGNFNGAIDWIIEVIKNCVAISDGKVYQHDATSFYKDDINKKVISSDPPYYDNICYADLSDFFYVWLRRAIADIYPEIFSTLLVPKEQELVATPYRFGGDKQKAKEFFEKGLGKAFERMNKISDHNYPLTIYYAFKQEETEQDGETEEAISSTGWETMLDGLIKAGLSIDGTWPLRSELTNRMIASGANALASSIVLVCRPRPENAPKTTRRQFLSELKRDLPQALKLLQQGNIAPVDLAQASIGPGMAIYSKYTAILESDGNPMRVRTALQLINQILDEFLTEQEGEFDTDTRWTLTWFEQHQFNDGLYGDAETLSKAKNTSIQGLVEAGILQAKAGKVRLLPRDELKPNWQPQKDKRISIWEITQYLIHTLDKNGETAAAELLAQIGQHERSLARDLAYRLYSLCDRKSWTTEAIAYNSLVISWPEILRLANSITPEQTDTQLTLI